MNGGHSVASGGHEHDPSPEAGPSTSGTFSAAVTSPLGLSVLALSVAAVARFRPWHAISSAHTTEESQPSAAASGGEPTTTAVLESGDSIAAGKVEKRTKDRRKRNNKVISKTALNRIIQSQSTKATTPNKHTPSRDREPTSYATSSVYSAPTTLSVDDDHHDYAQSTGSAAPSTLGDDLSSADGLDKSDHSNEFGSVSGTGDDEESYSPTPITPRALRAPSDGGLPALASLRLPRVPLRPSRTTVRVLNAFADAPRIPARSSMISESTSSDTVLAPLLDSASPPPYTSHSPAPSNATSSTTTNVISVGSSSSSQLSPRTPPAHLSMTPNALPLHALLADNTPSVHAQEEDEEDVLTPLQEHTLEQKSSPWLERVPPAGPRSGTRAASHQAHARSGKRDRNRVKPSDRANASSTLGALAETVPGKVIASSVSAPTALRPLNSAWDHSLDWGPTLGSAREADEEAEAAESRGTSGADSSPWGSDSSDHDGLERGRRPSNATHAPPPSSVSAPSMSASQDDEADSVGDAEEPLSAVPDIMFPSLNDPPTSPYMMDHYDAAYDDGTEALRAELEEVKMREERWRMECSRLAGEYERVRWAWTEEITKWTQRESEVRPDSTIKPS